MLILTEKPSVANDFALALNCPKKAGYFSDGKIETNEEISIKDAVEKSVEIEKLQRKIEQLKNKINKEPQFNKQLELKKELKLLQSELENKN